MSKGELIERVVVQGDLSKLSPEDRVRYYQQVCESIGLNPLTRPFEYITLNGKLTLYARKDATDQLRRQNSISIDKPDIRFEDDWIVVTVAARDATGRTDSDLGVVNRKDMRGDFGNALMKAVTKAKRRVTLSICGLGFLDETEVESIPDAKIESPPPAALPAPVPAAAPAATNPPAEQPAPTADHYLGMLERAKTRDAFDRAAASIRAVWSGFRDDEKQALSAARDATATRLGFADELAAQKAGKARKASA